MYKATQSRYYITDEKKDKIKEKRRNRELNQNFKTLNLPYKPKLFSEF